MQPSLPCDDATNPTRLTKLQAIHRPVDLVPRFVVVLVSLVVMLGLAAGMLGKNPLAFLIGVDNRYSNSQTQLALWFSAVATFYLATVLLRWFYLGGDYIGGVGITQNLVALTGLSALSFGGAKVITVQKIENAKTQPQPNPKPTADRPKLTDLVQNDLQQADLGDFQMILITLGAVAVFIVSAFYFLGELELAKQVTLPDVDSTFRNPEDTARRLALGIQYVARRQENYDFDDPTSGLSQRRATKVLVFHQA